MAAIADPVAPRRVRSALSRPGRGRPAARLLALATATPLATAMVASLLLAAALLHLRPADVSSVVAWSSTNVHNLARHPVSAMVLSVFVVPGSLLPNLVIVAVGFAVLERAVGARFTALIAVGGQVIATLLTEYGAALGAHWQLLAASSPDRPDVGVSYVMYAVLMAAVLMLRGPARVVGVAVVLVDVGWPFAAGPGMTTTGHLLSIAVGAAALTAANRRAARREHPPAGPPLAQDGQLNRSSTRPSG